jgi:hypothetical protein
MAIKKMAMKDVVLSNTKLRAKLEEKKAADGVGKYAPKPAPKGGSAKSGMGGKVAKGKKYNGIKREAAKRKR